ncbi:hypothetical protein PF001_g28852, partial [Phytophthora fragariae]
MDATVSARPEGLEAPVELTAVEENRSFSTKHGLAKWRMVETSWEATLNQLAETMQDIALNLFAGPLLSPLFREPMNPTELSPKPLAAHDMKKSHNELTAVEGIVLVALPVIALVLSYVLLRVIWKVPASPALPQHSKPSYGSLPSDEKSLIPIHRPKTSLVEEGEVAGDYEEHWYDTFDFAFLVGMAVYAAVMLVLTFVYEPQWLHESRFWLMQLPKLVIMMVVSLCGGIVCH